MNHQLSVAANLHPLLGHIIESTSSVSQAHNHISIVENLLLSDAQRASAAASLAILASKDSEVLTLLFSLAKKYAEHQSSIDDAAPYSYNGIEIISRVENHDSSIVEFLVAEIIRKYEGIPRWAGIRSLACNRSKQAKKAIDRIFLEQSTRTPTRQPHDFQVVVEAIAKMNESSQ